MPSFGSSSKARAKQRRGEGSDGPTPKASTPKASKATPKPSKKKRADPATATRRPPNPIKAVARWLRILPSDKRGRRRGETVATAMVQDRLAEELAKALAGRERALEDAKAASSAQQSAEGRQAELQARLADSAHERDGAVASAAAMRSLHAEAEAARSVLSADLTSMREQLAAARGR